MLYAILLTAWCTINTSNPVHAVLFLIVTFVHTSIWLLILGVDYIALTILLLYVGAISIIFLYVVMMLDIRLEDRSYSHTIQLPFSLLIASIFMWECWQNALPYQSLTYVQINWGNTLESLSIIQRVAINLYTNFAPELIWGALLFALAMVGVIVCSVSHDKLVRRQDLIFHNLMDNTYRVINQRNITRL